LRLGELILLETPIALYQLRKGLDPDVVAKAQEIAPTVQYIGDRRGKTPDKDAYREFKFSVGENNNNVRVRVFGKSSSRSPAWVHCDCGDFRYRWDWLLTKKESSSLYNTADEPPNVRNPEKKRGFCKHVAAALEWLKQDKGI